MGMQEHYKQQQPRRHKQQQQHSPLRQLRLCCPHIAIMPGHGDALAHIPSTKLICAGQQGIYSMLSLSVGQHQG
jgi:hypothetical protein